MIRPSTDIHDPVAASDNRLVVAISSRALFDLGDSHALFERDGLDAYRSFQIDHENEILKPGVAFPLVQKLLGLNKRVKDLLQITKLYTVFEVHEDEAAAIRSYA